MSSCTGRDNGEVDRLAVQASVEGFRDRTNTAWMVPRKGPFTVLDVGCSTGALTRATFGPYAERATVLGVDRDAEAVAEFNRRHGSPLWSATVADFDSEGWIDTLKGRMEREGIVAFDIVQCVLSLHHMERPLEVLAGLRSLMSDRGRIHVRTVDDAMKVSFPSSQAIGELVELTARVPGVSDRFHGSKVADQLEAAGFGPVVPVGAWVGLHGAAREEVLESAFAWRRGYFEHWAAFGTEQAKSALVRADRLLGEIRAEFADPGFRFAYFVPAFVAKAHPMKMAMSAARIMRGAARQPSFYDWETGLTCTADVTHDVSGGFEHPCFLPSVP